MNNNLNNMVIFVVREAVRTECVPSTIQAVHVAFALVRVSVKLTRDEEACSQERLQPWRAEILVICQSINHWTHLKRETGSKDEKN